MRRQPYFRLLLYLGYNFFKRHYARFYRTLLKDKLVWLARARNAERKQARSPHRCSGSLLRTCLCIKIWLRQTPHAPPRRPLNYSGHSGLTLSRSPNKRTENIISTFLLTISAIRKHQYDVKISVVNAWIFCTSRPSFLCVSFIHCKRTWASYILEISILSRIELNTNGIRVIARRQ